MDYKKLAAVFVSQGKESLANKVCKEKNRRNDLINLVFRNEFDITLKRGSIVRIFGDIANIFFFDTRPLTSIKFFSLTKCESPSPLYLLLFYEKSSGYKLSSQGIREVCEYKYPPSFDGKSKETIFVADNIDLEFAADKNLFLAAVVGKNEDVYKGRYDRKICL